MANLRLSRRRSQEQRTLPRSKSPLEAAEQLRKRLESEANQEEEEQKRDEAFRKNKDGYNLIVRISDLELEPHAPLHVSPQDDSRTELPSPAIAPASPASLVPSPLKKRKPVPFRSLITSTPMNIRPVRLLVASLGNPPPYHSTRHSAAHILVKSFASHLQLPIPQKNKPWSGAVTLGSDNGRPEYTLWQSTSLMNVSGVNLLKAWKYFLSLQKSITSDDAITALVVLHDELESQPGQLKIRRGEGSAKGHNGIKSVQASLQGAGILKTMSDEGRLIKIGIGIGRPTSRERDDVSAFVLGQITRSERDGVENAAGALEKMLEGEIARLGRS